MKESVYKMASGKFEQFIVRNEAAHVQSPTSDIQMSLAKAANVDITKGEEALRSLSADVCVDKAATAAAAPAPNKSCFVWERSYKSLVVRCEECLAMWAHDSDDWGD